MATHHRSKDTEDGVRKVRTTGREETVAGKWLAWNAEQTRIVARGATRAQAVRAAAEAGEPDVVLENVEATRRYDADLYAGGAKRLQELLDGEGGLISAGDVSRTLDIPLEDVEERREAGMLLAIAGKGGIFLYPSWQFTADGTLPGLGEVLADLRRHNRHPLAHVRFFLTPNVRLEDHPPLDLLRRGLIDDVRRAARAFGEQGAA